MSYGNSNHSGAPSASQSPWQPPQYIFWLGANGLSVTGEPITRRTPATYYEWQQQEMVKYAGMQTSGSAQRNLENVSKEKVEKFRSRKGERVSEKKGDWQGKKQIAEPAKPKAEDSFKVPEEFRAYLTSG